MSISAAKRVSPGVRFAFLQFRQRPPFCRDAIYRVHIHTGVTITNPGGFTDPGALVTGPDVIIAGPGIVIIDLGSLAGSAEAGGATR
jgi:hypothetical protein